MNDTSEQEVSSTKRRKSFIFPILWRVAVLTVGINVLTSLFTATPVSPLSLDSLAARTFALGFKAADYAVRQDKPVSPDYKKLSKEYKLSEKQIKRFFEVRSGNNSDLFTHYGAMGICAVKPLKLAKLELYNPFDGEQGSRACMEWLSNMRGANLKERLVRFAMTIDNANEKVAEMFADEVLVVVHSEMK